MRCSHMPARPEPRPRRSAPCPKPIAICWSRSSKLSEEVMTKLIALTLFLAACGDKSDADYKADVVAGMHASIQVDLEKLISAAQALQAAAPTGRGWSAT